MISAEQFEAIDHIEDGVWIGTLRVLGVPFHAAFYEMQTADGVHRPAEKLSREAKNEALALIEHVMPEHESPRLVRHPNPDIPGAFLLVISPFSAV